MGRRKGFVKFYHQIPILFQYLIEAPFVLITSWHRLFIEPTRLEQMCGEMEYQAFWILFHIFCLFLDLNKPILFLTTHHRCSMGFKSGDCDDHCITGTCFSWNQEFPLLAECLRPLSYINSHLSGISFSANGSVLLWSISK